MSENTELTTNTETVMRTRELRTIFVTVTGTDEIVEKQEQRGSSRLVEANEEATAETAPEYVAAMVKADGLSDALSEPEVGDVSD